MAVKRICFLVLAILLLASGCEKSAQNQTPIDKIDLVSTLNLDETKAYTIYDY